MDPLPGDISAWFNRFFIYKGPGSPRRRFWRLTVEVPLKGLSGRPCHCDHILQGGRLQSARTVDVRYGGQAYTDLPGPITGPDVRFVDLDPLADRVVVQSQIKFFQGLLPTEWVKSMPITPQVPVLRG